MIRRVQMRTEDTVVLANETKEFHTYVLRTDHDLYILKRESLENTWTWYSILKPKVFCVSAQTFFDAIKEALDQGTVHEIKDGNDLIAYLHKHQDVFNYEV
jgi:hypothetical protein